MPQPRMQHYLPRFYLEGFRDQREFGKTGRSILYVYKPGNPIRKSSPRVEARQRHIYTLDGTGNRFAIEESFARMESSAAEIVSKFNSRTFFPDDSERERLAVFVAAMLVRTPVALQYQKNVVGPAVRRLNERLSENRPEFTRFWGNFTSAWPQSIDVDEAFARFKAEHLQHEEPPNAELLGMLNAWLIATDVARNCGWEVLRASKHESFITCDYPVISGKPVGNDIAWGFGFGWEDAETYFPLTAKVCLRLGRKVPFASAGIYSAGVRLINRYLMQYADRFVLAGHRSAKLAEQFERTHGTIKFGQNAMIPNLDAVVRSWAARGQQPPSGS